MTKVEFDYILYSIIDDIEKASTTTIPISAEERLMVGFNILEYFPFSFLEN